MSSLPETVFEDGDGFVSIIAELTEEGLTISATNENGNCYGTTFSSSELRDMLRKLDQSSDRKVFTSWTCPGESAGYCDSKLRQGYEGSCLECPMREEVKSFTT